MDNILVEQETGPPQSSGIDHELENYETIEMPISDSAKEQIAPEKKVEYWDIEGKMIIMKVL